MKKQGLLLAFSSLFACFAQAHEVHGSNVTVTVKSNKIEVLQSTPLVDAKFISEELGAKSANNDDILAIIATGWKITAKQNDCELSKQAYRLAHDNSQLQMRYLFQCEQGSSPDLLALPWLMKAPNDHFIILNLTVDDKSKTTIFQKQDLTIELNKVS